MLVNRKRHTPFLHTFNNFRYEIEARREHTTDKALLLNEGSCDRAPRGIDGAERDNIRIGSVVTLHCTVGHSPIGRCINYIHNDPRRLKDRLTRVHSVFKRGLAGGLCQEAYPLAGRIGPEELKNLSSPDQTRIVVVLTDVGQAIFLRSFITCILDENGDPFLNDFLDDDVT